MGLFKSKKNEPLSPKKEKKILEELEHQSRQLERRERRLIREVSKHLHKEIKSYTVDSGFRDRVTKHSKDYKIPVVKEELNKVKFPLHYSDDWESVLADMLGKDKLIISIAEEIESELISLRNGHQDERLVVLTERELNIIDGSKSVRDKIVSINALLKSFRSSYKNLEDVKVEDIETYSDEDIDSLLAALIDARYALTGIYAAVSELKDLMENLLDLENDMKIKIDKLEDVIDYQSRED